ncbi:hypothetical protein [Kribbella catacumbae]|uniref:mannitol dehydrogenase family protein n=1 Tax=Kribbella catacumbae TaxID=460086 RepID=UPI00036CD2C4|nr:hypothetical protein [Kribbella catacumbae]
MNQQSRLRVVILGAGRIGCGYLAPLLLEAGHHVVLGCRTTQTAARIRDAGDWSVRVTGPSGGARSVYGAEAVAVGDAEFDDAVAAADLIMTSVGVGNVADASRALVRGLSHRRGPGVDIWAVENGDCAGRIRDAIDRAAAESGVTLPPIGVAGAVATVAVGRGSWRGAVRPEFVGDAARTMVVDAVGLQREPPDLPGVRSTRHYQARLREKLYVFNAGHAMTAYLGWLRRHSTIADAIRDPFVRPLVAGALLEARRAVLAAHPSLQAGPASGDDAVHGPVAEALARFGDVELADPIQRVARQPIRKLAPSDRLLGPVALLRRNQALVPAHFALGVAAALLYGFDDADVLATDDQARRLRGMLESHGVDSVLTDVCGLRPGDTFAAAVAQRYRGFVFLDDGVRFPPAAPEETQTT